MMALIPQFRNPRFDFVSGLACLFFTASSPSLNAEAPPNVLLVLVDDLAWTDLGCYGHPWHETPQIDRLAEAGMRFTQAYSPAPICSAARASIFTGKSTARLGFEFVVKAEPGFQKIDPPQVLKAPPFTLALNLSETTIAEHLKEAGYETAFFGKWHLNPHFQGRYLAWDPELGPEAQGFDTAVENFGSHPYSRKEPSIIAEKGRFHEDEITRLAVDFITQPHDRPFFLVVSHFYVHTPVRSPHAWLLDKYDDKLPPDTANRDKRVEYAAFVETLDHYVGGLLAALDETGDQDSTVVVFLSDNGGHPEYTGHRPLRGSKWHLFEGGIRVPMLVRWPGRVQPGSICHSPVIGYDLFPTFAEISDWPIDRAADLDGFSLLTLFHQPEHQLNRSMYWHFPYYHPEGVKFGRAARQVGIDDFRISQTKPQSAIRKGRYKLIYFDEDRRSELYDLSSDLPESGDLRASLPRVASELEASLFAYLNTVNARRPTPSPD